jgi:cysteinyl-tRNA synthetase
MAAALTPDERAEIEALIEARKAARRQSDWARADAIRARLGEMGVTLADNGDTTRWIKA